MRWHSLTTDPPAGEPPLSKAFVWLRYVLIAATVYLIVVEDEFAVPSTGIVGLFVLAVASNLLAGFVPAAVSEANWFKTSVIVGDTVWITLALAWSGHFNSDFVHIYFFVLLLAAIGESLSLVAIGAVFICVGYAHVMLATGEQWSLWHSPSIIRLPFLFTAAIFYGYLVDRMRLEHRRALMADNAAAAKLDLLATVSHEIRTPMNAILGCADILGQPDTGAEERQEFAATVRRNSEHLMRVLDDVLDYSKIEAGKLAIETAEVDPARVGAEIESTMKMRASEKGIDLVVVPQAPLPPHLRTDPTRLRQILINLVGNAIKFTTRGSVRLVVRTARAEEAAQPMLCFEVTDTGIGISGEAQARLFRPFSQADVSTTRRFGGTGLGLAISKRLAGLLSGDIAVRSTVGQGSTFTLMLPTEAAAPTGAGIPAPAVAESVAPGRAVAAAPPPLRTLLAEDGVDHDGPGMGAPEPAAEPLVSELADDVELRDLIARYVAALPDRAAAIQRSLADGDLDKLSRQAHDLRGTAGTYGFPQVTHEAGTLELILRRGRPANEIHDHVTRLIDLCRRARATRRQAAVRS